MKPLQALKKYSEVAMLALLLILAFGVRLYRIDRPIADWHSWRQSDTASVTREYVKHGIDLLHPKFQDLSSIPNGLDNPQGWRMVEFPLINGATALSYKISSRFLHLDLDMFMRLASVKFSLGSILILYFLLKSLVKSSSLEKEFRYLPLIAAGVFAFLPFNIFYSSAILPEVPLVFFILLSTWIFLKYIDSNNKILLVLGVLAGSIALLLKPVALFFWFLLILLALKKKGIRWLMQPVHFLALALLLAPFGSWRAWIQQYPQGIPANRWLFNGNGIRLRPAWFRWLFSDRLGRLILGYWGLIPFGLGVLGVSTNKRAELFFNPIAKIRSLWRRQSPNKEFNWVSNVNDLDLFMYGSLIGVLTYLVIFATGNVQHDYYQIIIIPYVALVVGVGLSKLLRLKTIQATTLTLACVLFMIAFGWYEVSGFFNVNNPAIVEAGKAVDMIAEPDALVIAPYGGDTAFLYQTNRRGWPIGGAIDAKIAAGADYYVTTSLDDEAQSLMSKYKTITSNDEYLLLKLN